IGCRDSVSVRRWCASTWPTRGPPSGPTPTRPARILRPCGTGPGPVARMGFLVVNAGSSSLKLQVLEDGRSEPVAARSVADWDGRDVEPIARLLSEAEAATAGRVGQVGRVDAVGHRVVHGGIDLCGPTVIDEEGVERIQALTPLAPLHHERELAGT